MRPYSDHSILQYRVDLPRGAIARETRSVCAILICIGCFACFASRGLVGVPNWGQGGKFPESAT